MINIFGGNFVVMFWRMVWYKLLKKLSCRFPPLFRKEGTNVVEGRRILNESGLKLITAIDLADVAQEVAELVA